MTEPLVCVPRAAGTKPAATAAAEPLDDPPGVWSGFQGLRVFPGKRKAHSVVTVFPRTKPPCASSELDHPGRPGRDMAGKGGGTHLRGNAGGGIDVLHPQGNPLERSGRPAGAQIVVGKPGGLERLRRLQPGPGVDCLVERCDPREKGLCIRLGGEPPVLDPLRGFDQTEGVQRFVHDLSDLRIIDNP